jgi:DNA-binding beta-propeller fold protein YncE
VFVADSFNGRIQEFTSEGVFIRVIGDPGLGPADVTVAPDGRIFAADTPRGQITVYDQSGQLLAPFPVDVGVNSVSTLAMDPSGQFLYAIYGNGEIQKYDMQGNRLLKWQGRGGDGYCGFGVDTDGSVLVGDNACTVQRYSASGVGVANYPLSPCSFVCGVNVDASRYIYAGNEGRVQVLDATGALLTEWGSIGTGDGEFAGTPGDIAPGLQNRIYVLDGSSRIQVFAYMPTRVRPRTWGALKITYR